jgi:hypothetical protein
MVTVTIHMEAKCQETTKTWALSSQLTNATLL